MPIGVGDHAEASHSGLVALFKRVLLEYGLRYWKLYGGALIFGAVAAGCTSSVAYLAGHVIDHAYTYRNLPALLAACAIVIVVFTIKGLAVYGQTVLTAQATNQITADGQRIIFEKLLTESLSYFAERHSSEFMAQVVYAAGAPANIMNVLVNTVGRDLLTLIGLLGVMVFQAPLLSLVSFLVGPPAVFFAQRMVARARALMRDQYKNSAATLETVQEAVQGIRVIKAFTLEEDMRNRISASIEAFRSAGNEVVKLANRPGPLMETLGGTAIAAVFAYGGYRVLTGGAKPGEFISFAAAFLLAYEPAKRLIRLNLSLSSYLFGLTLLFQILDVPASEPEEVGAPEILVSRGRIELKNVTFAYRPGEYVLRDLSFVVPPGRTTALVGPSGGGKSTIFNLLLRFYEAQSGSVEIDGQNILSFGRRSLREKIGYFGQDTFLFKGSIRENIGAGRRDATEQQIVEAAKAAYAHEFIMSFPRGYDTLVGELGMQVSTGQRQRIAIARTMLKDSPLLLLDEPTAALDSESERLVSNAIGRLCANRTTLVIAHRLHTIAHSDCIHVVENGKIIESGTHGSLIRENGRYAELFHLGT